MSVLLYPCGGNLPYEGDDTEMINIEKPILMAAVSYCGMEGSYQAMIKAAAKRGKGCDI